MVTTLQPSPMMALSAVLEHSVTEHVRLQQHLTRCDQPADPQVQSSSDSVSSLRPLRAPLAHRDRRLRRPERRARC